MDTPFMARYEGDGQFSAPSSRWAQECDKQFVVGEIVRLSAYAERSQASHNHEFAVIADLWQNLPERFANEPWAASPEHLRKFALIKTKFCDTTTYACGSKAEAKRWAKNLRPLDEYSIVIVDGTTVKRFTAQSQSKRAMGAQKFQESKQAILEYLEDLIGIDAEERAA